MDVKAETEVLELLGKYLCSLKKGKNVYVDLLKCSEEQKQKWVTK